VNQTSTSINEMSKEATPDHQREESLVHDDVPALEDTVDDEELDAGPGFRDANVIEHLGEVERHQAIAPGTRQRQ
jgi:hypothetical protein